MRITIFLTFLCIGGAIYANEAETPVSIDDVEISEPYTPVFQTADGRNSIQVGGMPIYQRGAEQWLRVSVEYETEPDWIDQLTLNLHVLLPTENNGKVLFSGEETYRDIPEGRDHKCDMYLHFNTLNRYYRRGTIEYAVIVNMNGKNIVIENSQRDGSPWWQELETTGLLLLRAQTPFRFINEEQYQAVLQEVVP